MRSTRRANPLFVQMRYLDDCKVPASVSCGLFEFVHAALEVKCVSGLLPVRRQDKRADERERDTGDPEAHRRAACRGE